MNTKTLYWLLLILLTSCGNDYWEVSKFNMNNNALEDNEQIKLIFSSRGPNYNKEMNYYVHLIAISQKTGDTVNILTTAYNNLNEDDSDLVFNFINMENNLAKLIQKNIEEDLGIKSNYDADITAPSKITKVSRDPKFDHIADNNFPTIIGFIVKTSENNE